jgi:hypothetical protein
MKADGNGLGNLKKSRGEGRRRIDIIGFKHG